MGGVGKYKNSGTVFACTGGKVRRQQIVSVREPIMTRALLPLLFSQSVGKMEEWEMRPFSFAPGFSFRFHCKPSVKLDSMEISKKRQGAYPCFSICHQ